MRRSVTQAPQQADRLMLFARIQTLPLLLTVLTAGLLGWGVLMLQDAAVMPVRVVGVDGEIRFLQRDRLEKAVAQAVNGSFFSLDLKRMRQRIEQLPWVESVSIRRVWPDTLRVKVVEQEPLAYWGEDAMVSQRGEVFTPEVLPQLPGLVTLSGKTGSAGNISRDYLRMRTLLGTVGLGLTHVWVDARQAWRLKTGDGLLLQLGRREVMPRLTRFVQLYPYLITQTGRKPERVDLRYTNGFTVRWQSGAEQAMRINSRSMRMDRGSAPPRAFHA
ncbi:MAG: FtsQ-type POTRA domain-containing protein [Candidatus Thiodiazotropha sp. (ex Epidulcina cf. delphinae)]|nr:FtsQ-type POTRA domain-containing protein [Candidatus Thiodiazotropha sp. (ex Epidulcina cf. delphinae)]